MTGVQTCALPICFLLKRNKVCTFSMSTGEEFQLLGAATEKQRAQYACDWWLGTSNDRPLDAERRFLLGWWTCNRSQMKDGAILFSALQVMVRILNTTKYCLVKKGLLFSSFLNLSVWYAFHSMDLINSIVLEPTFNNHSIGLLYDVKNDETLETVPGNLHNSSHHSN